MILKVRIIPNVLDGKSGYFKAYFTSGFQGHPDPNEWPSQVIHPSHGTFNMDANGEAEILLGELLPNQQYFMRVDIHVQPEGGLSEDVIVTSDIVSGITPPCSDGSHVGGPEIRPIDVKLGVSDIGPDSASISWRFFSFEEKQFIDGVQIRFTNAIDGSPVGGVPGTTPFIHRDTNFFLLSDLKSDTEYQVDLYLIPVPDPDSKIEYVSNTKLTFKTLKPVEGMFIIFITKFMVFDTVIRIAFRECSIVNLLYSNHEKQCE